LGFGSPRRPAWIPGAISSPLQQVGVEGEAEVEAVVIDGTIVFGSSARIIYTGNGEWQPLDERANN
jgi:hypothetical protein